MSPLRHPWLCAAFVMAAACSGSADAPPPAPLATIAFEWNSPGMPLGPTRLRVLVDGQYDPAQVARAFVVDDIGFEVHRASVIGFADVLGECVTACR